MKIPFFAKITDNNLDNFSFCRLFRIIILVSRIHNLFFLIFRSEKFWKLRKSVIFPEKLTENPRIGYEFGYGITLLHGIVLECKIRKFS